MSINVIVFDEFRVLHFRAFSILCI